MSQVRQQIWTGPRRPAGQSFQTDFASPLTVRASHNRVASGTKRATFSASPSMWVKSCRATVASSHQFDGIKHLSILVPTGRSGELRDFRGYKRGRPGSSWRGPRGRRQPYWRCSFRNRVTVSIRSAVRSACCELGKSAPGCVLGSGGGLLSNGVGIPKLNGFSLTPLWGPNEEAVIGRVWQHLHQQFPGPSLYLSARTPVSDRFRAAGK